MAGKMMTRALLCLLAFMCLLLPLTALAAVSPEAADGAAAQCLASLAEWEREDAVICTDAYGRLLMSFHEDEAFAAVCMDDTVALCSFYQEDDVWEVYWINEDHPFGVDENGVDLQPDYMLLQDGSLTWLVTGEDEATEFTATFDGWDWLVTGFTRYALADGERRVLEHRDEVIARLPVFSLHQEGEPEPVVIEGNKLVHYPESRIDAHYTVPDGVEIIGEYAFSDNHNLIRVTLPESVRIIEDSAFAYSSYLRVVDMPSTLERLGENAFDCTYVQQLTIPDGLTELSAHAFASADLQGTVVIPEGVTDIGAECFVFNADITDMYLPASLRTIEGETFQQGAEFWYIWDFNHIDPGETHMTIHAPAGTEAARFAMWSGSPYVIEDAREGTDLAAVTAQVQAALDALLPGATISTNWAGFPCVTYSADTVICFATREGKGWMDDSFICCFDRTTDGLVLRWVNDGLYEQWWVPETPIPLELELIGDRVYLMLQLGEETAVSLTFSGEDFRLSQASTCIWQTNTGGAPYHWDTLLTLPITDGAPLSEFSTSKYALQERVVQGAVFDGDSVLLSLYDVIAAAGLEFTYEYSMEGIAHFEVGDITYVLDEKNMTLTADGEEDPFNLILPAPGSDDFRSEIIDGRWMVDSHTVYCTFRSFLGWPIRINIDYDTQTVTVCREE